MRRLPGEERLLRREQPIHWGRTFVVGGIAATAMASFIDIFAMMGLTPFTYERYLGSTFPSLRFSHHAWTVGFLLNWLAGGVFAIFYAYCFEYVFRRASPKIGLYLGLWHSVLAAVAFFPFFNIIHEEMRTGVFPEFGLLGAKLSLSTPPLLIVAHLLYGATLGTLYGPVRIDRVRARSIEPGESGQPGDPDVIADSEDPIDRAAGY